MINIMKNIKFILLALGVILVSCKTSQPATKTCTSILKSKDVEINKLKQEMRLVDSQLQQVKKEYENCQEDSKVEDDILELSNLLLTVRERRQQKLDVKNELAEAQKKIQEMKKDLNSFSIIHEQHFSRLVDFYNYLIWD